MSRFQLRQRAGRAFAIRNRLGTLAGVRKPEPNETPLSLDEVRFAIVRGLLADHGPIRARDYRDDFNPQQTAPDGAKGA